MSKNKAEEILPQIIESEDDEPTELEYIEQLMDDFDLKRTDTIGDLLEALEQEDEEDENCDEQDNDGNP